MTFTTDDPEGAVALRAAQAAAGETHPIRQHLAILATFQHSVATSNRVRREGWHTPTVEALVLKHGVSGRPVKLRKGMRYGKLGQCFRNALHAVWADPTLTYCEGWAAGKSGLPMHHAWVRTPTGEILDPTWRFPKKGEAAFEYWGLPLQTEYVNRAVNKNNVYGLFYTEWSLMTQAPESYLVPVAA